MRWDPSFFRRSPLFWPVARAAASLEKCERWPGPDDLTKMFVAEPPVLFETARPKPRRHPSLPEARYDARIVIARRVPTRPYSWHDVANALVWASFPRAKLALHARQHRAISARLGADGRLPGTRTSEQDAIAMLDEGGVVLTCARNLRSEVEATIARSTSPDLARLVGRNAASVVIFGHAIYEGLARNQWPTARPPKAAWSAPWVRAAAYVVEVDAIDTDAASLVHTADAALAALLTRQAPIDRAAFASVAIDEALAAVTSPDASGEPTLSEATHGASPDGARYG